MAEEAKAEVATAAATAATVTVASESAKSSKICFDNLPHVLCVHFLTKGCNFGDKCYKFHPNAEQRPIVETEYSRKKNTDICHLECRDPVKCPRLHFDQYEIDPEILELNFDEELKMIVDYYNGEKNKYFMSDDRPPAQKEFVLKLQAQYAEFFNSLATAKDSRPKSPRKTARSNSSGGSNN